RPRRKFRPSSSFPSSAWERKATKLCFVATTRDRTRRFLSGPDSKQSFEAVRSQAELGNEGLGSEQLLCPGRRHGGHPALRLGNAQQERRVNGIEAQRVQLFRTTGDVDQQHLYTRSRRPGWFGGDARQRLEDSAGGAETLDRGDVDDEPAARPQA